MAHSPLSVAVVLLLAVSGSLGVAVGRAAPPEATRLFPPGGTRGAAVTVKVTGSFPSWPAGAWTERPGTSWEPQTESGVFSVTVAPDAPLGVHAVRFTSAEGATPVRRFVVGHLAGIVEAEPNDRPAQALAIETLPAVVDGVLEKRGDVDLVRVRLAAGETLVAQADSNRLLRTPADPALEVVDARQSILARSLDAVGLDPRVVFRAPVDGEYVVRVWALPEAPDSTIGLAGGESWVYRLALSKGRFLVGALPLAVTKGTDTSILPLGPGLEGAAAISIPAAATLPPATGARGTASLALEEVGGMAEVAVTELPVLVGEGPATALPVVFSGVIRAARETARHRFAATKDTTLAILVEGQTSGTELDPLLSIRDAAGTVVASTDDPTGKLAWKVPADGEYAAEVSDRRGQGGPAHGYRLTIEPPAPRVRPVCDVDRLSAEPGKPIEVAIAVQREHGHAESLEFALEGAPEGVTAEKVTSTGSGDTAAKVTLVITAAGPVSAPVRITARLPDEPDAVPLAVRFGPEGVDTLWLGVKAP